MLPPNDFLSFIYCRKNQSSLQFNRDTRLPLSLIAYYYQHLGIFRYNSARLFTYHHMCINHIHLFIAVKRGICYDIRRYSYRKLAIWIFISHGILHIKVLYRSNKKQLVYINTSCFFLLVLMISCFSH